MAVRVFGVIGALIAWAPGCLRHAGKELGAVRPESALWS